MDLEAKILNMRIKAHIMIALVGVILSLSLDLNAQGTTCWSNSRGDAKLTGVSSARLPDQPEMLWTRHLISSHSLNSST